MPASFAVMLTARASVIALNHGRFAASRPSLEAFEISVSSSSQSFIVDNRKKATMKTSLQVFDPAMCCSTGICGPSVDPELVRFAADLDWLNGAGICVERFNLAQQPEAFVAHAAAKQALESEGASALPLIMVNGTVKSRGTYPSRQQLAEWAGLPTPTASAKNASPSSSSGCGCGPKSAGDTPKKAKCCC